MINIKLIVAITTEIYINFSNSVPGINSHLKGELPLKIRANWYFHSLTSIDKNLGALMILEAKVILLTLLNISLSIEMFFGKICIKRKGLYVVTKLRIKI